MFKWSIIIKSDLCNGMGVGVVMAISGMNDVGYFQELCVKNCVNWKLECRSLKPECRWDLTTLIVRASYEGKMNFWQSSIGEWLD
jgi:hypothetical protein